MGFVDRENAVHVFDKALQIALGKSDLPEEWIQYTKEVAQAPAKTFIPMLGTALLAKATNRHVDVFSLKKRTGHKSYSARSLAKDVLVPRCKQAGIDIRTTGAEPLNNQPFFHSERVSTDLNVKQGTEESLRHLCQCLERADFLEDQSALDAFAAFLRARIHATGNQPAIPFSGMPLATNQLIAAVVDFVDTRVEGGKVGQALVAAVLDLRLDDVRTRKINDPGRGWPGDVGAFASKVQTQSIEVKQRPFKQSEILQFVDRVAEARIPFGRVAALKQAGVELNATQLVQHALERNVHLDVVEGIRALILETLRGSSEQPSVLLAKLPGLGLRRLREIEASEDLQQAWVNATTN